MAILTEDQIEKAITRNQRPGRKSRTETHFGMDAKNRNDSNS